MNLYIVNNVRISPTVVSPPESLLSPAGRGFLHLTDRIRGRTNQRRRKRLLSANPLCVHCEQRGDVTVATEVDHIIALTNGGPDTDENCQGLCGPCHERKTIKDMGRKDMACDVNGWPTDPDHHWNQKLAVQGVGGSESA